LIIKRMKGLEEPLERKGKKLQGSYKQERGKDGNGGGVQDGRWDTIGDPKNDLSGKKNGTPPSSQHGRKVGEIVTQKTRCVVRRV